MRRNTTVLAGIAILLGLVWACGSRMSSDSSPMPKPAIRHPAMVMGRMAEPAPPALADSLAKLDYSAAGGQQPESAPPLGPAPVPGMSAIKADRYIIKNATALVEVADSRAACEKLLSAIQTLGGYVGGYNETVDGLGRRSVVMQVRVPTERFDETLGELEPLGKVLQKQVTTQDVSEEYVDTDARARNLKATEERLLDHLTRSGKLDDILRIEQEVTRVREQIERLEGRLRFLNDRIQYSTIGITLSEAPKAEPIVPAQTFSTAKVFTEAARSLAEFGQHIWLRVIWYAVWSVVWLPCLVILWLVARRVRKSLGW